MSETRMQKHVAYELPYLNPIQGAKVPHIGKGPARSQAYSMPQSKARLQLKDV